MTTPEVKPAGLQAERQFPDGSPVELKPYVPALRHAERLAREELRRLRERAKAQEFAVLRRSHRELRELRQLIRTGERPEDV